MSVSLIFDAGSLAGRSWDLPEGGALEVGRSRSCAVRAAEPDVSGRHLVVRNETGRPVLEVFSAHRTSLDGAPLAAGDVRPLVEGSRVLLGDSLRFRIHFAAPRQDAGGETMVSAAPSSAGPDRREDTGAPSFEPSDGGETLLSGSRSRAEPEGGETAPASASALRAAETATEGSDATEIGPGPSDDDDGGTQLLETQMVTPDELEDLRGAHLRRQKRRVAVRSILLLALLGAAFGLYLRLSDVKVSPYLLAPVISFDGVISDGSGKVGVVVPYWNGGQCAYADDSCVRWDSRLGDEWQVPFTIVLTNYVDEASLFESREMSFARWREANMLGTWRDLGRLPVPRFLGGEGGVFPGVPCLQHRYSRVNESGENLAGTATFFRLADRCYVLLRELPADEEGRGYAWLEEVWTTLYARARLPDGSDNLFAARHWEGTTEADPELDPATAVDACRKDVENEAVAQWNDVERTLTLVLRALHGREDGDSAAIRAGALDVLGQLRMLQGRFWKSQCTEALRIAAKGAEPGSPELEAVRHATEASFSSEDDERHWLVGRPAWWLSKREGF
jgi:hypothetical protein